MLEVMAYQIASGGTALEAYIDIRSQKFVAYFKASPVYRWSSYKIPGSFRALREMLGATAHEQ